MLSVKSVIKQSAVELITRWCIYLSIYLSGRRVCVYLFLCCFFHLNLQFLQPWVFQTKKWTQTRRQENRKQKDSQPGLCGCWGSSAVFTVIDVDRWGERRRLTAEPRGGGCHKHSQTHLSSGVAVERRITSEKKKKNTYTTSSKAKNKFSNWPRFTVPTSSQRFWSTAKYPVAANSWREKISPCLFL